MEKQIKIKRVLFAVAQSWSLHVVHEAYLVSHASEMQYSIPIF